MGFFRFVSLVVRSVQLQFSAFACMCVRERVCIAQRCIATYQTNVNHRQTTYEYAKKENQYIDSPIDQYCQEQVKCK